MNVKIGSYNVCFICTMFIKKPFEEQSIFQRLFKEISSTKAHSVSMTCQCFRRIDVNKTLWHIWPPPLHKWACRCCLKKSNRLLMVINQLGFGKSIVIFHGWEREILISSNALNNLTRLWSYLKNFQTLKRRQIINEQKMPSNGGLSNFLVKILKTSWWKSLSLLLFCTSVLFVLDTTQILKDKLIVLWKRCSMLHKYIAWAFTCIFSCNFPVVVENLNAFQFQTLFCFAFCIFLSFGQTRRHISEKTGVSHLNEVHCRHKVEDDQ